MCLKSVLNFSLLFTLIATSGAMAETVDPNEEIELVGLSFTQSNPLTRYALKKNGKFRRTFKVPFSAILSYYEYVSKGIIEQNSEVLPLFDMDMRQITSPKHEDFNFWVDLKHKKAYPSVLLNPHSVSQIFSINPQAYADQVGAQDFLSAKRAIYDSKTFNPKTLRYDKDYVQLEDWRSLDHPPVMNLGSDLRIWDADYSPVDYEKKESVFYDVDFQKKIDEVSSTELTFGNKLELLANGDSYQRKISEIKKAKKSVLIAVMSFFCDKSSRDLERVLINKVAEGVDVKLMVEKVWTKIAMKKCMRRMTDAGVDVVYSNDLLKKGEESALFHNKFMIIDGVRVIMGGSNIVESDNISTGYNHMNRDNDIFVEGPIATEATMNYVILWKKYMNQRNESNIKTRPSVKDITVYEKQALEQKAEELKNSQRGSVQYTAVLGNEVLRNQGVCRMILQSPDTDKHKLTKVFMEFISAAQERINLTTGSIYFDLPEHNEKERARLTYNKRFFKTLFAATDRGVKIDLIGNGIDGGYGEISNMINRSKLMDRFKFKPIHKTIYSIMTGWLDKSAAKKNQPYLEYVQRQPNARAWANFQYMHSKMIQIDRVVSMVSSYNLEEWSADKSHETSVICLDKKLSQQMDQSFLRDFANAVPVALTHKK